MVHQRLAADVEKYQDAVDLHVMPPLYPLTVSPLDFSHTDELIERARSSTRKWLVSNSSGTGNQVNVLKLHRHTSDQGSPASRD
jgi:NTE family protein